MRALAWIACIMIGCTSAAPEPAPIVTDFEDARATTMLVPGGHHTELRAGTRVIATLDWDDASQSATVTMANTSRPLMVAPELVTPARAGSLIYAVTHAERDKNEPPGAWEDWCVFCSIDEYGILYCYFVPFCCGWPYDTCLAGQGDDGVSVEPGSSEH